MERATEQSMIKYLEVNNFFPSDHYLTRELFGNATGIVDALKLLSDYIDSKATHKHEGHIEPGAFVDATNVQIGKNTIVEVGAIIRAPTIIGENTIIRSGAWIRGHALIGDNCVVGAGTELHNVIFHDHVNVRHKNSVFSSIFGSNINFAGYACTANLRLNKQEVRILLPNQQEISTGMQYCGCILGDGCQVGAFVLLNPGAIVGRNCVVYPRVNVSGYVADGQVLKS